MPRVCLVMCPKCPCRSGMSSPCTFAGLGCRRCGMHRAVRRGARSPLHRMPAQLLQGPSHGGSRSDVCFGSLGSLHTEGGLHTGQNADVVHSSLPPPSQGMSGCHVMFPGRLAIIPASCSTLQAQQPVHGIACRRQGCRVGRVRAP